MTVTVLLVGCKTVRDQLQTTVAENGTSPLVPAVSASSGHWTELVLQLMSVLSHMHNPTLPSSFSVLPV